MAELGERLVYDPASGVFTWKNGKRAGCINAAGYLVIRLNGKLQYAHRLAWEVSYGRAPPEEIDHINGDRSDNRVCNLRLASHALNSLNRRKYKNNRSGFKGVYAQSGRWRARISLAGKSISLGMFPTKERAHMAYCAAADTLHGDFARHS